MVPDQIGHDKTMALDPTPGEYTNPVPPTGKPLDESMKLVMFPAGVDVPRQSLHKRPVEGHADALRGQVGRHQRTDSCSQAVAEHLPDV